MTFYGKFKIAPSHSVQSSFQHFDNSDKMRVDRVAILNRSAGQFVELK